MELQERQLTKTKFKYKSKKANVLFCQQIKIKKYRSIQELRRSSKFIRFGLVWIDGLDKQAKEIFLVCFG